MYQYWILKTEFDSIRKIIYIYVHVIKNFIDIGVNVLKFKITKNNYLVITEKTNDQIDLEKLFSPKTNNVQMYSSNSKFLFNTKDNLETNKIYQTILLYNNIGSILYFENPDLKFIENYYDKEIFYCYINELFFDNIVENKDKNIIYYENNNVYDLGNQNVFENSKLIKSKTEISDLYLLCGIIESVCIFNEQSDNHELYAIYCCFFLTESNGFLESNNNNNQSIEIKLIDYNEQNFSNLKRKDIIMNLKKNPYNIELIFSRENSNDLNSLIQWFFSIKVDICMSFNFDEILMKFLPVPEKTKFNSMEFYCLCKINICKLIEKCSLNKLVSKYLGEKLQYNHITTPKYNHFNKEIIHFKSIIQIYKSYFYHLIDTQYIMSYFINSKYSNCNLQISVDELHIKCVYNFIDTFIFKNYGIQIINPKKFKSNNQNIGFKRKSLSLNELDVTENLSFKKNYQGGLKGINENLKGVVNKQIYSIDIKSMYPNTIIQFNIEFEENSKTNILTQIMSFLLEERSKYDNQENSNQKTYNILIAQSIKKLANKIYGSIGSEKLKEYYSVYTASKICEYSRNYLQKTINTLENDFDAHVIYWNTDGLFFTFSDRISLSNEEQIDFVKKNILNDILNNYNNFERYKFKLENVFKCLFIKNTQYLYGLDLYSNKDFIKGQFNTVSNPKIINRCLCGTTKFILEYSIENQKIITANELKNFLLDLKKRKFSIENQKFTEFKIRQKYTKNIYNKEFKNIITSSLLEKRVYGYIENQHIELIRCNSSTIISYDKFKEYYEFMNIDYIYYWKLFIDKLLKLFSSLNEFKHLIDVVYFLR